VRRRFLLLVVIVVVAAYRKYRLDEADRNYPAPPPQS
jgi:hypothetical protein